MRQFARTKVKFTKTLTAQPAQPITPEGKKRVAKTLAELARYRTAPPSVLLPEAWPVLPDDAVLDWVKVDPEARSKVSWPVAQALAFLDGFRSAETRGGA